MDLSIDLKKKRVISTIEIGILENQNSWIFSPESISIEANSITSKKSVFPDKAVNQAKRKTIAFTFDKQEMQHIKLFMKNIGTCPDWHKGKGGKAWMFIDEIIVK